MKKKLFVTTLALLALPAIASAQGKPGGYFSGFLGFNQAKDSTLTTSNYTTFPASEYSDRIEFDPGIFIGGTGGYDFGMFRVEGELSYRHAEINSVNEIVPIALPAQTYRNIDGNLGVLAMMVNAYFDLENPSPVTPYWGAGIGVANLLLSDTSGRGSSSGIRETLYDEDDASVFAYQAAAGLEFAINPRFSLDLGYRYFRTSEAKFDTANSDIERRMRVESHNVALGFRAKF